MLRPLAIAYRMLDQDDKASEVCRAAVKMGGADNTLADFRAWLALELALADQTEEAGVAYREGRYRHLPDGTRLVLAMAEAVVMVATAGPGGKPAALAEAKDHLRSASAACAAGGVPARRGPNLSQSDPQARLQHGNAQRKSLGIVAASRPVGQIIAQLGRLMPPLARLSCAGLRADASSAGAARNTAPDGDG